MFSRQLFHKTKCNFRTKRSTKMWRKKSALYNLGSFLLTLFSCEREGRSTEFNILWHVYVAFMSTLCVFYFYFSFLCMHRCVYSALWREHWRQHNYEQYDLLWIPVWEIIASSHMPNMDWPKVHSRIGKSVSMTSINRHTFNLTNEKPVANDYFIENKMNDLITHELKNSICSTTPRTTNVELECVWCMIEQMIILISFCFVCVPVRRLNMILPLTLLFYRAHSKPFYWITP